MVVKTPSITPIILAGGFGTRVQNHFDHPKQFVIREYTSLYQDTLDRVSFLDAPLVVSNIEHKAFIETQSSQLLDIIFEPISRNTAAAVMVGALKLQSMGKSHTIILPSDHIIKDTLAFKRDVETATNHVRRHEHGILFGIEPHHPSSQFGYIQTDHFGNVTNFCEKPTPMRAAELLNSTYRTYWNSGISVFNIDILIDNVKASCPDFMSQCLKAVNDPSVENYSAIPKLPFDSLYLEQSQDLFCIEATFDWLDVGTPESILKMMANE